jgi:transposase InsO family protein
MAKARVDPEALQQFLDAGHNQAEAAKHFGVSEAAIAQRVKKSRIATSKVVALERAAQVVDQKLTAAQRLQHAEEVILAQLHDRDAAFSPAVDDALRSMNLRVLKTPVRTPQANAFCERLIGTARRECLDHVIPLNERHLRKILAEWVPHYNRSRPHASLGPGIPEPPTLTVARLAGHHIPQGYRVAAKPILAGLHHEYQLEPLAG